jgi:hypothetical protein
MDPDYRKRKGYFNSSVGHQRKLRAEIRAKFVELNKELRSHGNLN